MKGLLLVISSVLVCCVGKSQTAQKMYNRTLPAGDSVTSKSYAKVHSTFPDSTDTTRVIGFATAPLYKKQPESPLGNFMADCMKIYAEKIFDKKVDAAFVNFSGIRYYLARGDITTGSIYRLMPYDNQIVLLTIKGNVLKVFLDHTAATGGWPCAGITIVIKSNTAAEVLVNKIPLDATADYTVAVADYVANGGNQCAMLKGVPQLKKNYLFRDALIDYVSDFTKKGKPVTAAIENRVVRGSE